MPKPTNELLLTPEEIEQLEKRMKQENISMGKGDFHPTKLDEIKKEREFLRGRSTPGLFVPRMTVGVDGDSPPERPRSKSPGKSR